MTNSSCPVSSPTKLERGAAPTNQPPLLQIIPSSKILCCSLKKKNAKKNQPRSVLLGKPTGTLLGCPGNSTDAASELHFLDELLIRETSGNKCSFSSVFTRCKVRFWGGKKKWRGIKTTACLAARFFHVEFLRDVIQNTPASGVLPATLCLCDTASSMAELGTGA